jgi:hypothetical protein
MPSWTDSLVPRPLTNGHPGPSLQSATHLPASSPKAKPYNRNSIEGKPVVIDWFIETERTESEKRGRKFNEHIHDVRHRQSGTQAAEILEYV